MKKKTSCIIFRTNRSNIDLSEINFKVNNETIGFNESTKFLGIITDATLSWSYHIAGLSKKLNSICYSMRILRKYVNDVTMKTIYYASFISKLKFGILFWGSATDINKIFILQKQVIQIMDNSSIRETCRGKFKKNKVLTVFAIYIYECLVFNFKHKDKYIKQQISHSYGTRCVNNYNFPIHRLSMYEKGPFYSSMKFFNILPEKIKNIKTFKYFKREIFNFLVEVEPYTISEYLNYRRSRL